MSDFRIAWLFPDTLFLHGERGNLLALARFARLAGFEPEIIKVDFDTEDFDPFDFNVIFCGPGEIVSFQSVIEYLIPVTKRTTASLTGYAILLGIGFLQYFLLSGINNTCEICAEIGRASCRERV